ncbi:MAG: carboxypeptidase-like regulatory domain-containing protein [Bacteroidales bacterium]|nr:carboxypeptidase-like regulatory domain-containing protein [Bacteroidales bacterium]
MRIDGDSTDIRGLAGITGFNYGTVAGCYSTGTIVTGRGADRVAGITFGESPDGCYYKANGTIPAGGSEQGFRVDDIPELNSSKILATLNTIIGLDNRVHYKTGDSAYKNPPAFTTEKPATQPVSGKATAEPDGYPIENARITLKLSGNTIATTVTDKEGNYTLQVIPEENYVLTADKGGYRDMRLKSFNVTDSPVTGKNFGLTIIPEYAWYTANPSAERFTITSSAELRTLAAIVNGTFHGLHDTFEGKSIALNADIDLSEEFSPNLLLGSSKKWKPIGNAHEDSCFNGTFDGNGHSIKYIYIDPDSNYELHSAARTTGLTEKSESTIPVSARSYQGLFGSIGTKGRIFLSQKSYGEI